MVTIESDNPFTEDDCLYKAIVQSILTTKYVGRKRGRLGPKSPSAMDSIENQLDRRDILLDSLNLPQAF